METNPESEKGEQESGVPRSSTPKEPAKTEGKKEQSKKDEVKKKGKEKCDLEKEKVEEWDVAVERPPISADDSDTWTVLTKTGVAILSGLLFLIVFVSTGLTRVIIHLMIWKLNPPSRNSSVTLNKLGGLLQLVEERARGERCVPVQNSSTCLPEGDVPTVNVWWIWGLIIAIIVPDIYSLILSLWRIFFKETAPFDFKMLSLSLVIETFHTTGLCLLVFLVLPAFDPITASVVSLLIVFFPGLLSVFSKFRYSRRDMRSMKRNGKVENSDGFKETESQMAKGENNSTSHDVKHNVLPILGFVLFFVSIAISVYYIDKNQSSDDDKITLITVFVFSLILVSVIYWENFLMFTSVKSAENGDTANSGTETPTFSKLRRFLKDYINSRREKVYLLTTLWKVALTIAIPFLIFSLRSSDGIFDFKVVKALSFFESARIKTLTGEVILEPQTYQYDSYGCQNYDIELLVVVCVILGFISFKSARFACRVYLQILCFSIPLTLSLLATPLVFIAIMKYPLSWTVQQCSVVQPLWELKGTAVVEIWQVIVVGILGFFGCIFITLYIWTNNGSKLLQCDRLFRKPPYCGIFLDLSLMLTRCKDTSEQSMEEVIQGEDNSKPTDPDKTNDYLIRPFVYFCATMWHETETEMTQLLKSIFRVDYDQYLQLEHEKKIKKKYEKEGYVNEDVFDFEVHLFFDDAFKARKAKNGKNVKGIRENEYVKTLEEVIVVTAKSVYGGFELEKARKFETPYGARFEWNLLTDEAKLVVHLKDKTKIRNRKRWSQVMYLYYLLSFKMNEVKDKIIQDNREQENKNDKDNKKDEDLKNRMMSLSANTFILALDGDVDFKPEAVTLLLDRMKKNPLVGAACGRIHPIGSGPMVWYQKFEYAISHWLQKATEHVFGCVLCSPGCFSLFRGSALLDDNVMKTYTRMPTEAAHYIQYDQGEDRWLCTLLLKKRFRVEYCAASDALTFAPEGFYEFYKQRRRWAPSTMANILDLLMDGNSVRKTNQNISRPYIFYHLCLFISSILTPGTIFLLIMGAIITAFPAIEPWLALLLNGLPVAIFIISIFLAKEDTQLLLAAIFSTIYSLVMLVVLIGLLKEGIESQFCSVTTVFFCFVAGVFVIAAILHPMEMGCILHGLLYFLAVPSMSMLLIFYSVGNMHNVNWGTRENKSQKVDDSSHSIQKRFLGQSCSIGDWCRCILCVTEKDNSVEPPGGSEIEEEDPTEVETTPENKKKSGKKSKTKDNLSGGENKTTNKDTGTENEKKTNKMEEGKAKSKDKKETETKSKDKEKPKTNENKGMSGKKLGMFKECEEIGKKEMEFWKSFIKKYLKPNTHIADSKKETMQAELIDLRNKVFFFYFITNAIFVTVVYVLTQVNSQQNTLSIPLPCSVGNTQGKIEPISIAFTLVFGLLLLIQFFGMLMHRVSTISHIMASTKIFGRKLDTKVPMQKIQKPVTLQDEEPVPKVPIAKSKKGWATLRAGFGLRLLSGEKRQSIKTLNDLRQSLSSKLETINENPDENTKLLVTEILSQYSNEPVPTASVRNPIYYPEKEKGDNHPGPSSA